MRATYRIAGWLAFLLSPVVLAQTMDFDGVCATAPCAIGSSYQASGVTFTPNTAQIVAAGTNGLTGPFGGKYLSVAAFPYEMTIRTARQATSFSMVLSRANTSAGPFTVVVTWLKATAIVGTTSVTLTNVGSWSHVSGSSPSGFDSIVVDPGAAGSASFGIDRIQIGGTCNGFTDLVSGDPTCNAAEWLANRNVTLGCASGHYCPAANVTRAQMALFMQRLGNAMAPSVLRNNCQLEDSFSPPLRFCFIDHTAAFPQVASARAACALVGWGKSTTLEGRIVVSTDGGATWASVGSLGSATGVPGWTATIANVASIELQSGRAYRFGLLLYDRFATPMGDIGAACELIVDIHNRNPASAPFDVR